MTLTFSIFRSESLQQAWTLLQRLFTGEVTNFIVGLSNTLQIPETYAVRKVLEMKFPHWQNPFYMICLLLLLTISIVLVRGVKAEEWIDKKGCKKCGIITLAVLFVWSFISLSQVSTFLYFDF